MNAEALPYTLLLVLVELAVGGLWVLWGAHLRGHVARSFVQFSAALVAVTAGLALLAALKVSVPAEVEGYPLDDAYAGPARLLLAVTLGLSTAYFLATLTAARPLALALGGAASLAGLGTVAALAGVFSPPAWGYAGVFLALAVGSLVAGGVSLGMVLGHWYLVTPRLPERPLREVTAFLLAALAVGNEKEADEAIQRFKANYRNPAAPARAGKAPGSKASPRTMRPSHRALPSRCMTFFTIATPPIASGTALPYGLLSPTW